MLITATPTGAGGRHPQPTGTRPSASPGSAAKPSRRASLPAADAVRGAARCRVDQCEYLRLWCRQVEVTAHYRFTSGNPAGRRIFLFIKATKAMGLLQSRSVLDMVELHSNKTQDTIHAAGMTMGIENGPFEMWLGEGSAGMIPPLISDRDLTKISNVVTVAAKQQAIPGMPNIPGMPGRRPPFGPRGMGR